MKKLLISSATIAASLFTVSFANGIAAAQQQTGFGLSNYFVAATAGFTTNDQYDIKGVMEADKANDVINYHPQITHQYDSRARAVNGGLQLGADLFNVSQHLALGVEINSNYSFRKSFFSKASYFSGSAAGPATHKFTFTRWSLDPMVFIALTPVKQITVKARAGFGYQHLSAKINSTEKRYHNATMDIATWKPVIGLEAAYHISSNIAVVVGDNYTFGKNWKDSDLTKDDFKKITSSRHEFTNDDMPRENFVYAGLQYTF